MYLVFISRDSKNASNGRAQYRVNECLPKWHGDWFWVKNIRAMKMPKGLIIETNKPYRVGNLINPRKALGI